MVQTTDQKPRRSWLIPLAILMVIIGFGASLILKQTGHREPGAETIQLSSGTLIPNPRPLEPFSLIDHHGNPFNNESLKGQWHLLSFGYTHCPDVCPTTLAMLARLDDRLKQLEPHPEIQTAFISVDPERDTQQVLAGYMPYFNSHFLGVTGDPDELAKLTQPLGIMYARVEAENSHMGYLMDHSSSIILINPEGEFQAIFGPHHEVESMAQDLIKITAR